MLGAIFAHTFKELWRFSEILPWF